ncbi:fibronectin type III domain-containing protein [Phytohabitans aurantiacus]|uniref:Fibronectin type-III domain-containing protein n=1 Tax=Phytohabitans aurantiacus TaxID=3016789 RepID=A0ABQ5QXV6_9ACTN|nr:fibronectin type III domain-containing protein [Phytohabitans aurantiacus]GLH98872.1 hypothetical protein Pa4123_41470 [Phytohabitans aurantiacus]
MVTTGNGTAEVAATKRRSLGRGGLVTIGTVVTLVAAMGLTILGLGAADHAVANYDASSWLWSSLRSEMARVNGTTGRVDTRLQIPKGQNHTMQVAQTDRFLILRDLNTGQVSSLDLATLQITATTKTTAGVGVSVALQEDAAFVIDAVQGIVRQLDPRTLAPIGEPVNYPPGLTGGQFDGDGNLWLAVPSEGTVSAVTAAPLPAEPVSAGGQGGGGLSPKRVRTVDVANPSHDLTISTLDHGVAVLNRTMKTLTTIDGDKQSSTPLTMDGLGSLPPRTNGTQVPVTVPEQRHVWAVDKGHVKDFGVPGKGSGLQPAVAWAGRFYAADNDSGTVYVFDTNGRPISQFKIEDARGPLEMEVRENYLFINAPNSQMATVVDDKHQVRTVDKYANDVLGGDPPPAPPPPKREDPPVSKPGAPRTVTATAGNTTARVSWSPAPPNGSAITRYVVEGADKEVSVGANQRSIEVTGLTNGEEYRFSVHAVNAKGAGPAKQSNPVTPTSEIPDAPTSVTAEARPDGTVLVKWPEANGQGYDIRKYAVTAVAAGATAPAGESTKTELVVPAGQLEYGNQYAFQVVSVNEKGGASEASPISNSVVPFTTPEKPESLTVTTVQNKAGTVKAAWAAAVENGRPITKYVVEAGGKKVDVTDGTSVEVGGFGEGETITVKVRAVNEAGEGAEATETARTVAKPGVTVTGKSATTSAVTVTFRVEDGGGNATCSLDAGGKTDSGSCTSLTVTGLSPGTAYDFTVSAKNAAGTTTAQGSQTTDAVFGIATCNNGPDGDQRTYCDSDRPNARNGNEIFASTSQSSNQVGWASPGSRLKAFCKKSGQNINAWIYNDNKESPWWIQVDYSGKNYIPWAWFDLEAGDNIDILPNC